MRRAMLGSRPHVHVFDLKWILDQAKSGHFVVDPESLILIWRAELDGQPARDWRATIGAIRPQAQANRTPHLIDALPLLIEQAAMDLRHAENAVRAHEAGLLDWEFRHHGAPRREAVAPTAAETRMLRELSSQCSDEVLVLRTLAATRDVRKRYGARVTYWFGPCDIWATMLAERQCDAIVITPRWTQRGPNGSMVVTAGPSYSVEAAKEFQRDHPVV